MRSKYSLFIYEGKFSFESKERCAILYGEKIIFQILDTNIIDNIIDILNENRDLNKSITKILKSDIK